MTATPARDGVDRARLAALLPDLGKGVRAAIATVVPFYLARELGRPELTWVALAGWLASLADPGGSRRVRVTGLALFVVGGALAALIGTACAGSPVASAAFVALGTLAASLARAFGGNAASIGTMIAIVIAIAAQATASPPLYTAGLVALGGAWAVVLSSIVWPVWPHRPLRDAVARVYAELADYVDAIAGAARIRDTDDASWAQLAREHQRRVRAALEAARATMVELRARRIAQTTVGANTRMILGEAESELFRLIAYADELEARIAAGAQIAADEAVLAELAISYREVRDQLITRRGGAWQPDGAVAAQSKLARELVRASRTVVDVSRDLDALPPATYASGASAAADADAQRQAVSTIGPHRHSAALLARVPSLAYARDALTLRSPIVHHALRVALAALAALIVGRISSPSHAQWVSITAVAVLQPYLGPTLVRVVERVIGTIVGCALAIGLIGALTSPLATALAMFPLAVIAVVTRPRSYRLFVMFLTPVFLLVADRWHPSFHTALVRIADVALGGVIAVVAALIRPSWERARLPDAVDGALAAVRAYVELAFGGGATHAQLVAARRAVGVALETAEASLERMFAEPRRLQRGTAEAVMLLTYARRISGAITALTESRALPASPPADVRDYVVAELDAARRFVTTGEATLPREAPATDAPFARLVHHAELVGRVAIDPITATAPAP